MPNQEILGLIAGNGKFPFLFASQAKKKKFKIVAVGIKGDTSWWLNYFVHKLTWVGPGELHKLFSYFKAEGIKKVIMAGQVNPDNLFKEKSPFDAEFQKIFATLKDRKADTIFKAVAEALQKNGMELMNSTFLLDDFLAPRGTLTKRAPTLEELADIDFGIGIAKAMGFLDVGQTVVVKEKAIVAIEAMEGTDRAILRGGAIARQGAVVVKMSKPTQDFRFDVPVIGPRTIANMIKCRAACISVEAGKTLLIDREQMVKMADRAKICIVAA